jgi:hypothetical protein
VTAGALGSPAGSSKSIGSRDVPGAVAGPEGTAHAGNQVSISARTEEEDKKRARGGGYDSCESEVGEHGFKRARSGASSLVLLGTYNGVVTDIDTTHCTVALKRYNSDVGKLEVARLPGVMLGQLETIQVTSVCSAKVGLVVPTSAEPSLVVPQSVGTPGGRFPSSSVLSIEDFCSEYFITEHARATNANEKATHRATVLDEAAPLLCRCSALAALFSHGSRVFRQQNEWHGKPPLGVVYAARGAGTSELFHRLAATPEQYFEDYVRKKPAQMPGSPLDPATCLYAAISFASDSDTAMHDREVDLLQRTGICEKAIALRMVFQFLAPPAPYKNFLDAVCRYASAVPAMWSATFRLRAVLRSVCAVYGKQRVFLLVDQLMLLKEAFRGSLGEGKDPLHCVGALLVLFLLEIC